MKLIYTILGYLSSIYYVLVLLPKSFLSKNSEARKRFHFDRNPGGSYFYERNHTYGKKDFEGS